MHIPKYPSVVKMNMLIDEVAPQFQWIAQGLSSSHPILMHVIWMQDPPSHSLMQCIGGVYGLQALLGSSAALDSLACFYTVHELVSQSLPLDNSSPGCGSKRRRQGGAAPNKRQAGF